MKKYLLLALLGAFIISCTKDNDQSDGHKPELGSIKFTTLQSNAAFTGALEIFPCAENTTSYVGNYRNNNTVWAINPSCVVENGAIRNWGYELLLPLGTYNMIYWGISGASAYSPSRADPPPLTIGSEMSGQYWSMALNADQTTYMPVWDQVMAVQDVKIGSSGLSVDLSRKVAGLNVIIKNSNGTAFDPSISSFEVLVGGIAEKINFVTGAPENQTKTVRFALTINEPSRTTASNLTVMLYPSAASPAITINVKLSNGQVKSYTTNLQDAFQANSVQNITILTADILGSDPAGSSFTIDDWKESSQTIDAPIF